MPLHRLKFFTIVGALALVGTAGVELAWLPAAAAEQDVVKIAERLNKKAMEDYDNLEFDAAKQTLQSAIAKLRDAGQDETLTAARIYVNLGMVYFTADKDRNRAVNQFVEALKIDGTAQLDPERATPELQEVYAEAQKKAGRGGKRPTSKPARPVEPPPTPSPDVEAPPEPPVAAVHGLQHNSVDEARAGADVLIRAQMGPDVVANRLFLFYRSGGQEDYVSVPMTPKGGKRGEWVGTIPGDAITGRTCQYYIEARDSRGRPAVASGTAASPYIITITGVRLDDEKPPGLGGDEDPLAKERRIVKHQKEDQESNRGYGRLFFNLMAGTGLGIELAGNQYEVAYQYHADSKGFVPLTVSSTGTATAPLHGALEIGVNLNRHFALSAIARLEGTLINNADSSDDTSMAAFGGGTSKASTAFAGLLRFRYNFGEGRFRPGLHIGVGGGQIRHVLDITTAGTDMQPLVDQTTAQHYMESGPGMTPQDPFDPKLFKQPNKTLNLVCRDKNPCYDNIAIGYALTSVGGSVYYDLTTWKNGGFGVIVDVAAIFAFGGQFGINIDAQFGVGGHFL